MSSPMRKPQPTPRLSKCGKPPVPCRRSVIEQNFKTRFSESSSLSPPDFIVEEDEESESVDDLETSDSVNPNEPNSDQSEVPRVPARPFRPPVPVKPVGLSCKLMKSVWDQPRDNNYSSDSSDLHLSFLVDPPAKPSRHPSDLPLPDPPEDSDSHKVSDSQSHPSNGICDHLASSDRTIDKVPHRAAPLLPPTPLGPCRPPPTIFDPSPNPPSYSPPALPGPRMQDRSDFGISTFDPSMGLDSEPTKKSIPSSSRSLCDSNSIIGISESKFEGLSRRESSTVMNTYTDLHTINKDRMSVNLIDLSDNASLQEQTSGDHEDKWQQTSFELLNSSQADSRSSHSLSSESTPHSGGSRSSSLIDRPISDIEVGPSGGIWNPGYIGLDEYRRMMENAERRADIESTGESTSACESESAIGNGIAVIHDDEFSGSITADEAICFSSWCTVIMNKKDRGRLWAVLRSNVLFFQKTAEECEVALGPFSLQNFVYVGCTAENDDELNIAFKESVLSVHWHHLKMVTGCSRQTWIPLFIKCLAPKHTSVVNCLRKPVGGGEVWIRQGATCPWTRGWAHVENRKLFFMPENCARLFQLDIRKFLTLRRETGKVDWCASVVGSLKGPLLVTMGGSSLYLQAESDLATTLWADLMTNEMEVRGSKLEDYKLTSDDVPVLVDKCIKYISTYGLFQPGLYRKNGSKIEARALLDALKKDPVDVHITNRSDDMVNVVADVLRGFFRQLDEPLIPHYMHERLFAILEIKASEKADEYNEILSGLSKVRLQTLKKLLDHLRDVTDHSNSNLATIRNVAEIFGPSIFCVDRQEEPKIVDGYGRTMDQVMVTKELIENYAAIFRIPLSEIHAKSQIDMLHGRAASIKKARADGFLVPVNMFEKDNHTFNVQSSLTAEQVLVYSMA
ncbi:hypothetical protein AB6A40_002279 [Gnathostoma spinigerum]|uniref:Rho-GAP domain-containing protein n=1 Tax=Gnathostoma spinigerum TaxID=75299 RepID=A0ABD6EGX1_9BILA